MQCLVALTQEYREVEEPCFKKMSVSCFFVGLAVQVWLEAIKVQIILQKK